MANVWLKEIKCKKCKRRFPATHENIFLDAKGSKEIVLATCPHCGSDTVVFGVPTKIVDEIREEV